MFFLKTRPCLTNMMQFFEEEMNRIDEVRAVEVVNMDFSKA